MQDYEEYIDEKVSPIYDKGFKDGYNKALEEYKDIIAVYEKQKQNRKDEEERRAKTLELLGIPYDYYNCQNPEKVKQILDLYFKERKTVAEIGQIIGITPTSVKERINCYLYHKSHYKSDCIIARKTFIEKDLEYAVYDSDNSLSEEDIKELKEKYLSLYLEVYDMPCGDEIFSFTGRNHITLNLNDEKARKDFEDKCFKNQEYKKDIPYAYFKRDKVLDCFNTWFDNYYEKFKYQYEQEMMYEQDDDMER